MDATSLIPAYQPLPFPAPVWLLQTLLVVGLFLHVIPMNVILGGGLLSSAFLFIGRSQPDSHIYRAGRLLATSLPLYISFAITQGIVPLLFLQLLYGPMYYTSSVLMAVPWIALIGMLLVAYYSAYLVIYRYLKGAGKPGGTKAPLLLFVMSLLFMGIAFLFTNNMTLMLTPEKWLEMYQASRYGLNLNLTEPQLVPRYLHFLLASVAVAGLTIGCYGVYWKNRQREFGDWQIKTGSRVFLACTLAQIPVGLWFLMSLPKPIMMSFMGRDMSATVVFGLSLLLTVASIVLLSISSANGGTTTFLAGLSSTLAVIFTMLVVRHIVREQYLKPFISPDTVPVQTQWDLLTIFILAAVGLIVYLTWLSRTVWGAYNPGSTSSQASTDRHVAPVEG